MEQNALPTFSLFGVSCNVPNQWLFENVQINMSSSNVQNIKFLLKSTTKHELFSTITNSTFGKLVVAGKYSVKVQDMYCNSGQGTDTLMELFNSSMEVKNCVFTGEGKGNTGGILRASSSKIALNTIHIKNVKTTDGIIHIMNGSHLIMNNVSVTNNGLNTASSAVQLSEHSSTTVKHSLFSGNKAANGSCFYLGYKCSATFTSSHFSENVASDSGGVVYCESESTLDMSHCQLIANQAHYSKFQKEEITEQNLFFFYGDDSFRGGGVVWGNTKVKIVAFNCFAKNNTCESCYGAVIVSRNYGFVKTKNSTFKYNIAAGATFATNHKTDILIEDCTFQRNGYGTIFANNMANITVKDTKFLDNFNEFYAAAIMSWHKSSIFVEGTLMRNNTLMFQGESQNPNDRAGCVYCWRECLAVVKNSSFELNMPGVFLLRYHARLSLVDSHFVNHSGTLGTLFLISVERFASILLSGSAFTHNSIGVLEAFNDCNITIKYSKFLSNQATSALVHRTSLGNILPETDSSIWIELSLFENNECPRILHSKGNFSLRIVLFSTNVTQNFGTVVFVEGPSSRVKISHCSFTKNSAMSDADMTVANMTLVSSMSIAYHVKQLKSIHDNDMIILHGPDTSCVIYRTMFCENKVRVIKSQRSVVKIRNSTFVDNREIIFHREHSYVNISECSFFGTVEFKVEKSSKMYVANCTFQEWSICQSCLFNINQSSHLQLLHVSTSQDRGAIHVESIICSDTNGTVDLEHCFLYARDHRQAINVQDTAINIQHCHLESMTGVFHNSHVTASKIHFVHSFMHFTVSNASLSDVFIEFPLQLDFYGTSRHFLLVKNATCAHEDHDECLILSACAANIIVEASTLATDALYCPHLPFPIRVDSFRLTECKIHSHTSNFRPGATISKLLTWNVSLDDGKSVTKSSDKNFLLRAKGNGLFNLCHLAEVQPTAAGPQHPTHKTRAIAVPFTNRTRPAYFYFTTRPPLTWWPPLPSTSSYWRGPPFRPTPPQFPCQTALPDQHETRYASGMEVFFSL